MFGNQAAPPGPLCFDDHLVDQSSPATDDHLRASSPTGPPPPADHWPVAHPSPSAPTTPSSHGIHVPATYRGSRYRRAPPGRHHLSSENHPIAADCSMAAGISASIACLPTSVSGLVGCGYAVDRLIVSHPETRPVPWVFVMTPAARCGAGQHRSFAYERGSNGNYSRAGCSSVSTAATPSA